MQTTPILSTSLTALALAAGFVPGVSAQNLKVSLVASGFNDPLYLCSPPGDTARLFIVEQNSGHIEIIENGVVLATPFLDLGALASSTGERGVHGLAFHPNYFGPGTGAGKFYVDYTDNNGDTVIRQYSVSANPNVADAASFQEILTIAQPFANNNGGCLQFGPDGMLYASTGDGGGAGDPGNRAQDITDQLLGKILRFDIDLPAPFVPADNPFVGVMGDDEIWAYGFRHPWRFSFDRVTGDLWIADVGAGSFEEVNFEPADSAGGLNYGWRCMEATSCTGQSGCTCNSGVVLPVDEYDHNTGCAVQGGYRYRGSEMPSFVGRYFYADFCSARVWSFAFDGTTISDKVDHRDDLAIPGGERIVSFGEDANGELYLVDQTGGEIWRIEEECNGSTANYCQVSTNSSGGPATISSFGSLSVGDDNFNLSIVGAPASVPGLFFFGPTQQSTPFGNGFLCAGLPITRMPPSTPTDFFGTANRNVSLTSGPASVITAGSTWNFQYWFRDDAAGGAMFNTSDGLSVVFCP